MLQFCYTDCNMQHKAPSLESYLKEHSYSVTKPRQFVFDTLNNSEPLTMNQLINKLKGQVDRVTVYRVIELFEKLHIVHRITIGWKYKLELSEGFRSHHHHITCTRCDRIESIEDPTLEAVVSSIATQRHFTLSSHHIELQGLCQQCHAASR